VAVRLRELGRAPFLAGGWWLLVVVLLDFFFVVSSALRFLENGLNREKKDKAAFFDAAAL
jgi:hypothetical protein